MRLLHLQQRHMFRLFHMKCMSSTLNTYSLHLHIYDRCGMCARLTWLFLEVSTHTHWHARTRTETHIKALRWRPVYAWLCLPSSPQGAEAWWKSAGITAGLSLRRPQCLDVIRNTKSCLIEHECHQVRNNTVFDSILHLYWGVYLRIYEFDLFSRRV